MRRMRSIRPSYSDTGNGRWSHGSRSVQSYPTRPHPYGHFTSRIGVLLPSGGGLFGGDGRRAGAGRAALP